MTARDVLRIIRKRILLIISCLVIMVLVTAIATEVWLRTAPFYTARAYLAVAPRRTITSPCARSMPSSALFRVAASTHGTP